MLFSRPIHIEKGSSLPDEKTIGVEMGKSSEAKRRRLYHVNEIGR
jgi:hypothetical protein